HDDAARAGEAGGRSIAGLPDSRERRRLHWTACFGVANWRNNESQFADTDIVRRWFYESFYERSTTDCSWN
ncbi:MAG TPA: hypothetical protein VFB99_04320, partial [Vicinamibacterales bacterium]|nr:hypothetical protein [Vicinamibacterales bacterium]